MNSLYSRNLSGIQTCGIKHKYPVTNGTNTLTTLDNNNPYNNISNLFTDYFYTNYLTKYMTYEVLCCLYVESAISLYYRINKERIVMARVSHRHGAPVLGAKPITIIFRSSIIYLDILRCCYNNIPKSKSLKQLIKKITLVSYYLSSDLRSVLYGLLDDGLDRACHRGFASNLGDYRKV